MLILSPPINQQANTQFLLKQAFWGAWVGELFCIDYLRKIALNMHGFLEMLGYDPNRYQSKLTIKNYNVY